MRVASVITLAHEIGHNVGLLHSGVDAKDTVSSTGVVTGTRRTPPKRHARTALRHPRCAGDAACMKRHTCTRARTHTHT